MCGSTFAGWGFTFHMKLWMGIWHGEDEETARKRAEGLSRRISTHEGA